jgi:ribosomal protein L7Ae-like RNA K-turn-binding protein
MTDSDERSWVVGRNQSLRVIRSGKAKRVILAKDAEASFMAKMLNEIKKAGAVEIDTSYTSKQLAEKAGVDVPTAIITEF